MISNPVPLRKLQSQTIALCGVLAVTLVIAGCNKASKVSEIVPKHINNKTKFSSKEFGVAGSPRVTTSKQVRKGGGRYQVGKPYTIRGKKYYPKEDPDYVATGMASWYGPNFHGRLTANGEIYDQYSLSAAHPTMPLPSYARVTSLDNGSSVLVRVNDRGPYAHGRIIDLSAQAAKMLGYDKKGVTKVKVEYVGKARMDGLDAEYLAASFNPGSQDPSGLPIPADQQILLAENSLPRMSLAELKANNVARTAPLPQVRPVSDDGLPVVLPSIGLSSSYAAESDTVADELFSGFDFSHNASSDTKLIRLQFGPFASRKSAQRAEAKLLSFGPVTFSENKLNLVADSGKLHLIQRLAELQNVQMQLER